MKKFVMIIGFRFWVSSAFAQAKEITLYAFSLAQATDFAIQNQKDIKNAIIDEAIAHQRVNEIMGMALPQINSSFDVKDFLEIPTSFIPASFFGGPAGTFAAVKFGTKYQATAGFDASQLLFSGDYFLGLKASKVFVELSERSTQRTKIETVATVSKAYYTVLVNDERMKLMEANVSRVLSLMNGTNALVIAGFAEKIDFDRLTVTYNNLLVEQEKVKKLLSLGMYLLKFQMGMDMSSNLTLTDKLADVKLDIVNSVNAEKFEYSKRTEYNLFDVQFKLAKLDVKRQKFAYLPSAFAYGNLNAAASRNDFDMFKSNSPWYPVALIGATVKMPIFTGLQRHAKGQQAKLKLKQAENNMDFIKKSIDLELASSSINLQNASTSLENQKKNIAIAEDVVRVSKIKFEQGVGTNIEMINAETALKEAQTNYYNALFDALIAKIDFDKANGLLIK